MTEIIPESGMTRREFLKRLGKTSAKAAVASMMAGEIPLYATKIVDLKDKIKIPIREARDLLFARLGFSKGRMVFKDHIPSEVQPEDILIGEVRRDYLFMTQTDVNAFNKEVKRIGGTEYPSRSRMQDLYNAIRTAQMAIATDGKIDFSQEYLRANVEAVLIKDYWLEKIPNITALVAALIGTGTTIPEVKKSWEDISVPRRLFLKAAGVGIGSFSISRLFKKEVAHKNFEDLRHLPPLERKLIGLVSKEESTVLRNKIMTANQNALTTIPLSIISDQAYIFAGGNHSAMANEILRDPKQVNEDLRNFLIGTEKGKKQGILYKLFDLFENAADDGERRSILGYAVICIGDAFGPVTMRINHNSVTHEDIIKSEASLFHLQQAHRDHMGSDSAFVTFARALKTLDDGLKAGTDPVIRGKKAQDAWNFFQKMSQLLYTPQTVPAWTFNEAEQYELGGPVGLAGGQEQIDLFVDRTIYIDRRFVTGVDMPAD